GDLVFPSGVKDISSDMNPTEMAKVLKKCCKFFSQLEQEEEDLKRTYLPFCHFITQDEFIKETSDEHCRILIGCILADLFRLYAPENPFRSGDKIKDIFMFVTDQLRLLKDSKGPFFPKAFHILENIATIKSYNICIDLDDPNTTLEIFCSVFKTLFSTVNSGHDKQVRTHMLDIMGFAITDSASVPQPLLDIILECLLDTARKMNPSAYELARDLLKRTVVVVEQFLMQFFQNVILANRPEHSRMSAHWTKLIPELYKITPQLLLSVLPQLELRLRADNSKERLEVVTLLSDMWMIFINHGIKSTRNSQFLFTEQVVFTQVRCACVNFFRSLAINHGTQSHYTREVMSYFKPRRHDTDDQVRLTVVSCIRGIAIKDIQLASDELLEFVKER
uniref:Uncharacterized protein n=1 Tax=Ciona savignyi TaxID=51511 RepID=H2YFG7_CIOSA